MISLVSLLIGLVMVVHVDGACMTSSDCKTCVSESPDSILEGLRCQMCLQTGTLQNFCVGDFADNLGVINCTVIAKNALQCDGPFSVSHHYDSPDDHDDHDDDDHDDDHWRCAPD
jgi:hypothetical protein